MTKGIAVLLIVVLSALNSLGNFWFTYGIWPRSWVSFATFFGTNFVLMVLMTLVTKPETK